MVSPAYVSRLACTTQLKAIPKCQTFLTLQAHLELFHPCSQNEELQVTQS